MSYEETMRFSLTREDEGSNEEIELRFQSQDLDIHEVLKKFAHFLISMSYAPETIQQGFDRFNVESV